MARALYSLIVWLLQPLLRAKLARRGRAEPGYLDAIPERFGRYSQPPSTGWVWVHAVSLGEARAAAILLAALRQAQPGLRVLLTHGTATGRAEGGRLLQPGDVQVWLPWDTPGAVARFLAHFRPRLGLLMETEVWPNLVAGCRAAGVPLWLVNARMSEKSLRQGLRLRALSRPAYAGLAGVLAQTGADAERLRRLGARVEAVVGNLKFDAEPDAAQLAQGRAWRAALGRPLVMLASSREGEEAVFLENLKVFQQKVVAHAGEFALENEANRMAWLIVPRHPQRFDAVAALVQAAGFTLARRSAWGEGPPAGDVEVWLGDSLGEMALYYGLADVALLGGSFEPLGGQNLIEALACGCPVVMGPHTFNFAEAAAAAETAEAAFRVAGMGEGLARAVRLVNDRAAHQQAAQRGSEWLAQHRGAAGRMAAALAAAGGNGQA